MVSSNTGPFHKQLFFTNSEFENICKEALKSVDLYPDYPQPIRIDRFIEKKFGCYPVFEGLEEGILGFTEFGEKGVESIVVSKTLDDENDDVTRRRLNTTLAHEAGHGLLHTHLFLFRDNTLNIFNNDDVEQTKVLCRNDAISGISEKTSRKYDGRWWEFQANKAMSMLLLPKDLVTDSLRSLLDKRGIMEIPVLPQEKRRDAISLISDTFDVNPIVGRIRLDELFPNEKNQQLTL